METGLCRKEIEGHHYIFQLHIQVFQQIQTTTKMSNRNTKTKKIVCKAMSTACVVQECMAECTDLNVNI